VAKKLAKGKDMFGCHVFGPKILRPPQYNRLLMHHERRRVSVRNGFFLSTTMSSSLSGVALGLELLFAGKIFTEANSKLAFTNSGHCMRLVDGWFSPLRPTIPPRLSDPHAFQLSTRPLRFQASPTALKPNSHPRLS
jgi:hypothetical protein